MKFLIDECLSPSLAAMARERGFPESTHVTWIGSRYRQDWALVRHAVDNNYVLVTHNSTDFTALMQREPSHPGLVCMNVAHGLMSLNVQQRLFAYAMTHIAVIELASQIMEKSRSAPTGPSKSPHIRLSRHSALPFIRDAERMNATTGQGSV